MAAGLDFTINLSGNLSSALGQAGHALANTAEQTKHAKKEFELFESETGKLSGAVGGLGINFQALAKGGSFFTFDLAEALHGVYEMFEKITEKVFELGKELVKTAASSQDLDLAVRLNVGPEDAEKINALADSFQRTTRFSSEQIKRSLLPLLKEGVSDVGTLDQVATIATDLAARNAGGIADVQQTVGAFANIFQRGRIKPAMLSQFGIQAHDYFEALSSALGMTSASAERMAKQGKISQDKLIDVAIGMIAKRQGGSIGQPSLDAAQNMGGTLERLANVGENLFKRIADGPGMKAIQDALDRFVSTMNGPAGAKLMASVDNFLSKLGEWLTPERIGGFVESLTNGLASAFNWVAKIVGNLNAAADLWRLVDAQKQATSAMFFGDSDEKRVAIGNLIDARRDLATHLNDLAKLEVQGAQKVPALASGGIVTSPTLALVGESGPEAVMPLKDMDLASSALRSGRGDLSIQVGDIVLQVQGGGTGNEIGLAAAQTLRVEFKKLLDEVGWAYGATVVE